MPAFSFKVEEQDVPYEDDVAVNPYSLKSWWRYIKFKSDADVQQQCLLAERALTHIPGSYKIWHHYLNYRKAQVSAECITSYKYEELNELFERSLEYMNKMPRVWFVSFFPLA